MDCCWNTGCWCFSWVQLTCRLLQGLIVTFLLEPSRTKGSLTTGWKANPLFLLGLVILRATDHHCLKAASALLNPHLLLCPSANPETFLGDHWRYCTFGLICSWQCWWASSRSHIFLTFPTWLSKQKEWKFMIYYQSPPTGSRQKSRHLNRKSHIHICITHSLNLKFKALFCK